MARKILVIDDEPHILITVSNRLRANGYEVVTALSGRQGLESAKELQPDLILLDCIMPEMPGEEVLHRLKEDPALGSIPVIMFTANIRKSSVSEFRLRGAAGVVFKPFAADDLLHAVAAAFGDNS
ncbi:MAG: Polar-differentiation response regulator DivK [Candidatus Omnitrophica bacterium ADurb.Bin277]|nr:MAG: Polar-differentiation response regulator DivK [Candidatus Omnitrophica bacterium ADurb.Bin277]